MPPGLPQEPNEDVTTRYLPHGGGRECGDTDRNGDFEGCVDRPTSHSQRDLSMLRALTTACLIVASSCALAPLAQAQDSTTKTTNSVVREHMEVVGSDKGHVGTVDKYDGKDIKLTKSDSAAGGQHHLIPSSWVGTLNGHTVILNKTAREAMAEWKVSDRPKGDAKN